MRASFLFLFICAALFADTTISVPAGHDVTLGVTLAKGSPPLSYQWMKGGRPINQPGMTNATMILPKVIAEDTGVYSVVVSNSAGTTTSDSLTLTVALDAPDGAAVNAVDTTTAVQSATVPPQK